MSSVQNDSTPRRATPAACDTAPSAHESAAAAGLGCRNNSSGFLASLRDEIVRRGEQGRAESAAAMEELVRLRAEPRAKGFVPRAKQILREMRAFAAI